MEKTWTCGVCGKLVCGSEVNWKESGEHEQEIVCKLCSAQKFVDSNPDVKDFIEKSK